VAGIATRWLGIATHVAGIAIRWLGWQINISQCRSLLFPYRQASETINFRWMSKLFIAVTEHVVHVWQLFVKLTMVLNSMRLQNGKSTNFTRNTNKLYTKTRKH
jgi:hypothetical protein